MIKRIIKRSTIKRKPKIKLLENIKKITIKIDNKLFKDKNIISFSNHDKPYKRLIRKSISTEWKFYPSCLVNLNGKFGYTSFTLGKKKYSSEKKRTRRTRTP